MRAAFLALIVVTTLWGQSPENLSVRIAGLGRCSDVRDIVLKVLPGPTLTINGRAETLETLGERLDEIYKWRWSKHLYVTGDPKTTFGDVLRVLRSAAKHVDYVVIVTPTVMDGATYRGDGACLAPNLPPGYPR